MHIPINDYAISTYDSAKPIEFDQFVPLKAIAPDINVDTTY